MFRDPVDAMAFRKAALSSHSCLLVSSIVPAMHQPAVFGELVFDVIVEPVSLSSVL